MNKLSSVSSISAIRRIEPATLPGPRVHTTSNGARERYTQDVHSMDTSRLDGNPKMRLRRATSADLLNSMIRRMGGALVPSAKGSYIDVAI